MARFRSTLIILTSALLAGLFAAALAWPVPGPQWVDLFDGRTLRGWDGDPVYWRVENGCIVGEVTPATLLKRNSFLIWRGGSVGDGELLVEYRVSSHGNSGVNYRSVETPKLRWSLTGYQADIDGQDQWSGQNYEERGRTFLAYRGQRVTLPEQGKPVVTGSLGDRAELQKHVKKLDWNIYRITLSGPLMRHTLNGMVMSEVTDLHPVRRRFTGLLGVQVHVGPPMRIEYRRIRWKPAAVAPAS